MLQRAVKTLIFIRYDYPRRELMAQKPAIQRAVGPIAQSVEQRTFNPWVDGSSPSGPTFISNLHNDHSDDDRSFKPRQPQFTASPPTFHPKKFSWDSNPDPSSLKFRGGGRSSAIFFEGHPSDRRNCALRTAAESIGNLCAERFFRQWVLLISSVRI